MDYLVSVSFFFFFNYLERFQILIIWSERFQRTASLFTEHVPSITTSGGVLSPPLQHGTVQEALDAGVYYTRACWSGEMSRVTRRGFEKSFSCCKIINYSWLFFFLWLFIVPENSPEWSIWPPLHKALCTWKIDVKRCLKMALHVWK